MKIAVLFGSFNPLTNAHVAAMKAAVEHLGADKGLFVATNGQYLRRKTVKIGDPFYLTEEERRDIIQQVCASENKLEFWGFEMGGMNPARYKTLCKIQRQYPDAQLYEIQGADKVATSAKFGDADDYLSHIRFAVFSRSDIDLDSLFATIPLLNQHKDAFVLLPALSGEGEISSTVVRERFYAGEDYSSLVPAAAVEVLKSHQPSDFTISYEERMKTIIRSGRFGPNAACKEVYNENKELFYRWQQGSIHFGDYQDFLDRTVLYRDAYSVADRGAVYPSTEVGCINCDCVDVAQNLLSQGYNPAILNLASAHRPGGGYDQGMRAQEESLCQRSNLSLSLYQYADPAKAKCVRDSGVPTKCIGYPFDIRFGGIYTPNVTFFRHGIARFFTIMDEPFCCDVITVAALSFNGRSDYATAHELNYRSETGGFTPEGEDIMLDKIRTIFRMGVEHGKDALVLGAFGCGAYKLPTADVVRLFRIVMEEPEFAGKFRRIVFAIKESTRKPNGPDGKFGDFYREFGTYSLA